MYASYGSLELSARASRAGENLAFFTDTDRFYNQSPFLGGSARPPLRTGTEMTGEGCSVLLPSSPQPLSGVTRSWRHVVLLSRVAASPLQKSQDYVIVLPPPLRSPSVCVVFMRFMMWNEWTCFLTCVNALFWGEQRGAVLHQLLRLHNMPESEFKHARNQHH